MDTTLNSSSTFDYRTMSKVEFGFPPGVKMVDMIPDDIRDMIHPHWNAFPPVNPMWHYVFGIVFALLGITSVIGEDFFFFINLTLTDFKIQ